MAMPEEGRLAQTLVELADTLVDDFDVVELLTRLTDHCIEVLEVDAVGIMLVGPDGALRVMAASSETARLLEAFEISVEEGPCLECFTTGRPVVAPDLAVADTRWPRFAPEARRVGFLAVHALPMRLRGSVIGALNLFHRAAVPMPGGGIDAGQALADIATIAILQHRAVMQAQTLNEQLGNALNSRVVIEQAKGMVAERSGSDIDRAFALLRGYARNHNLKLADVAADVIEGRLPIESLEPPYDVPS